MGMLRDYSLRTGCRSPTFRGMVAYMVLLIVLYCCAFGFALFSMFFFCN